MSHCAGSGTVLGASRAPSTPRSSSPSSRAGKGSRSRTKASSLGRLRSGFPSQCARSRTRRTWQRWSWKEGSYRGPPPGFHGGRARAEVGAGPLPKHPQRKARQQRRGVPFELRLTGLREGVVRLGVPRQREGPVPGDPIACGGFGHPNQGFFAPALENNLHEGIGVKFALRRLHHKFGNF
ncbi:unnamed protein product [Phytomonas sp. Hart1]|nr:unnamed protein product [Phytomonas sp. Hart1]|eukprot:CCW67237.1 unnamed protein product [Phytomonas sp. isolate Hart1]